MLVSDAELLNRSMEINYWWFVTTSDRSMRRRHCELDFTCITSSTNWEKVVKFLFFPSRRNFPRSWKTFSLHNRWEFFPLQNLSPAIVPREDLAKHSTMQLVDNAIISAVITTTIGSMWLRLINLVDDSIDSNQLNEHFFVFFSAKILAFYVLFYAVLAGFFAAMLYVFYQTLDENKPKWQLDNGLIGANPGLGFRPMPPESNVESTLVWFEAANEKNTEYWIGALNEFLTCKLQFELASDREYFMTSSFSQLTQKSRRKTRRIASIAMLTHHRKMGRCVA